MASPGGSIIGRVAVKVLPDTSDFRDELRDKLRKEAKYTDLKVRVELDTTHLKAQLDKVKEQLKHWRDQNDPLKIGVEVDMLPGQTPVIAARLAYLTRPRTVHIIPVMSSTAYSQVLTALAALSGARVLKDMFENIKNVAKEFDRLVPKIGTVALALGGLTNWLLAGVSNVSALTLSLAQMFTATLAMPGLFAGMGVGIGIFVVALTTLKDEIPELMDVFSQMREQIGANFWAEAGQGALALAQQYLPLVATTASRLGEFFGSLGTQLAETFGSALPGMFKNLDESINIATANTGVFASVITALGTAGSEYLPRFSTWVGDLAKQFDAFLTRTSESGELTAFIEAGIQGWKDLGNVIKYAAQIIGDIGAAAQAGGGSTLGILADTLERIREVTKSPEFQTTLTSVFQAAHDVMSAIGQTAGPAIVSLFQELGRALVEIAPALGEGLGIALGAIAGAFALLLDSGAITILFDALKTAVIALAPALPPVATAIASLAPLVAALLGVIAPLVSAALVPLAEIVQILAPALIPLVEILGGALLQVIEALAPALISIAQGLVKLLEAIMPVVTVLLSILVPALNIVIGILQDVIEGIINGLTNAFGGISKIFSGFATMFSGGWDNFWKGIKEVFSGVWQLIVGIVEVAWNVGVVGLVRKGFLLVKGLFSGGWATIKTILKASWDGIKAAFRNFIDVFWTMPSTILSNLKRLFSTVWFNIRFGVEQAWVAILRAIKSSTDGIWKAIKSLPGEAKKVLGDLGGTLRDAGVKLIQGFINGITGMISKVKDTLSSLTSKLTSWKGPESVDRVLLYEAGQLVIGGFIKGLESQYDAVRRSLGGLSDDVASFTVAAPGVGNISGMVDGAMSTNPVGAQKVLNYYAAPGSSMGSEEDLFAAASRARMVGW